MASDVQHYDREKAHWDEVGTDDYATLSAADRARIGEWIGWRGGGRILDIGGGAGMVSRILLEQPDTEIYCLDISHAMLRHSPVPGVQADAMQLPFAPDSFDLVVGAAFLHHLPGLEESVLAECHRVMRRGARLVGYDPNGSSVQNRVFMGRGRLRLRRFTPDELPIVPADLAEHAARARFAAFRFNYFTFRNETSSIFETVQTRLIDPVAKGPLRPYLERWFFWTAIK